MTKRVILPWEQRLGIIGESEIKTRLSYFTKATKEDVDLGIDFRCELLENDTPTIPFFVQAKGTEHFDSRWGAGIKKSTIIYWLDQRYPVYLVVYDEESSDCYWMAIEDYRYDLLQKLREKRSNTIYLTLDRSRLLKRGKNKNREFINSIRQNINSIEMFWGRPQPRGSGYVKVIPQPPRTNREAILIKENTRMGLYSLIQWYLQKRDVKTAHLCCKFLAEFDKSHYNHFVWLGQLDRELERFDDSKANYKEALRICRGDKNWPKESMDNIIELITNEIKITEKLERDSASKST